jgi:hypothetical protein
MAMGAAAARPVVLLRFLQLGVFLAFGVAALSPATQESRVHHYHFLVSPSSCPAFLLVFSAVSSCCILLGQSMVSSHTESL